MQRLESSNRKVNETHPILVTNLESRCNYWDDAMAGSRKIPRYASQQIFPGQEDQGQARCRNHVPNIREAL